MDTVIKVKLWDKDVAAVVWDKDKEYAVVEFYESFGKEGFDIAPLMMPLGDVLRGDKIFFFPAHRGNTYKGLPGIFADSLPDDYGNSVIDEWFASRNIPIEITPLDRLCYVGRRGMGALEYEPANEDATLNESSLIEITHLAALANEVLNPIKNFRTKSREGGKTFTDILKVGTSAGGAKPKAIIAFDEQTKEIRSGQVSAPAGFTYWLLKFDGVGDNNLNDNPIGIGRIEYAYYKMAIAANIKMSECQLLYDANMAHFMTKRFDRTDLGDKLHTQTLCAIAHFDRDESHSYEQAFQTMRKLYLPYSDMEEMYRRMVFNVVARNHDDHTKNHSFLMDKTGQWSLAPAYDLCYSYSPSGMWTKRHQMSLNGKREDFTYADLFETGTKADIKNIKEIIEQVVDIVSEWKSFAKDAGVENRHIRQIEENLILKLKV